MPALGKRKHLLLPKAIKNQLPPLGTHEKTPPDQIPVVVKFFCPYSQATWYITEGEYDNDAQTWQFFGFATLDGVTGELGYLPLLNEFEELTVKIYGTAVPAIERDCHFGKHTLAEVMERLEQGRRI